MFSFIKPQSMRSSFGGRCVLVFALAGLALTASAQSADPKHPQPLQDEDNIAVIHSLVQIPQYYSVTLGPGKGSLTIRFSANGFPGKGGQIRLSLQGANVKKDYSVTVASTQALFSSNSAKEDEVTIPFDVPQANDIVLKVDPPSNGLVVAAGRYNIKATGAVKFGKFEFKPETAVGTYRIQFDALGGDEQNQLVKLTADGKIESETGSTGTWSLFDKDTKTYVLKLGNKRSTVIFWPAVGFCKDSAGNPDLMLVK
jgi:hypothetical protein